MKSNKSIAEKLITKRFINMVAKFNEELKEFAKDASFEITEIKNKSSLKTIYLREV